MAYGSCVWKSEMKSCKPTRKLFHFKGLRLQRGSPVIAGRMVLQNLGDYRAA